jgi:hypothetical protein
MLNPGKAMWVPHNAYRQDKKTALRQQTRGCPTLQHTRRGAWWKAVILSFPRLRRAGGSTDRPNHAVNFGLPPMHRFHHSGNDLPQDWRGCREIQTREAGVLEAKRFTEVQPYFGIIQEELAGGAR